MLSIWTSLKIFFFSKGLKQTAMPLTAFMFGRVVKFLGKRAKADARW